MYVARTGFCHAGPSLRSRLGQTSQRQTKSTTAPPPATIEKGRPMLTSRARNTAPVIDAARKSRPVDAMTCADRMTYSFMWCPNSMR